MNGPRHWTRAVAIGLALLFGAVFTAVFLTRVPSVGIALARLPQPLVAAAIVVLASYAAGIAALAMARAIFRRVGGMEDPVEADGGDHTAGSAGVLIIGGGIAQAGDALFDPLARELDALEWRPGGHQVRIIPAKLGEWAGAIGAAREAMLAAD